MANLPEEITTTVFNLHRRLLQLDNNATAVGFTILEQFGETEETIPESEELENIRKRALSHHTRQYLLLWQVAESQPEATSPTMNLLAQSIEETAAVADAGEASTQEVKRNWNLP